MRVEQVWSKVQDALRARIGTQNYDIWIRPIRIGSLQDDTVFLEVPNRYYRDWVQENYAAALQEELSLALAHSIEVGFRIAGSDDPEPDPLSSDEEIQEVTGFAQGAVNDKTFENFVVGACNQFAHAASLAVADSPGEPQYNPLFIYGPTGLGKTHLLHAIGNRIRSNQPDARVAYVSAEQFTNEMIDALRYRRMAEFHDRYRKHPTILLMDDVQFVGGRERTQEVLFHTFEWLKERGRQVVFTADVLPREIRGLEPRLRTRCEGGMLADTQPPDMETMLAILRQKADSLALEIPDDLASYVASRVQANIRELEGVLHRLKALSRLHRAPLNIDFARRHLGNVLPEESAQISTETILQTVASFYNVKVSDLKGARRMKQLVKPRHVAMYLIRHLTQLSFPEIGRAFGNRDHATIQHACKKIRSDLDRDVDLRNAVKTLERSLGR